jgi:hypothetical protein
MISRSTRALRRYAAAAACCALAVAVAACGSASAPSNAGTPNADPASAVPASALGYIQADVRPTGSLLAGIDAASQRLLGISDPGAKLDALIDGAAPSGVSYENDIRPWLGEQAAVALLSGTTTAHAQYAIVLDQTNGAKATAAIKSGGLFENKDSAPDKTAHASYGGVSYTEDLTAKMDIGVVGSYVVIANDAAAFDAIVDTVKGAASLAGTSGFKQAVSSELAGADGVAYVPLLRLVDALAANTTASRSPTSAIISKVLQVLRTKLANAIVSGSARFDSNGAAIDIALSGATGVAGSPAPARGGSETNPIATLPGGSWLAVGATNVGPTLAGLVTDLGQLGSAGSAGSFSKSLGEIQQVTGINIEGDLRSITTVGAFAKGSNLATLEAGLVLAVNDSTQATTIVTQLKELLSLVAASDHSFAIGGLSQSNIQSGFTIHVPGVPFSFDVAAAGSRVVVALGTTSLNDALASGGRLSGTSTYGTATSLLGSGIQPDVIVSLPDVVALLQNLGRGSGAAAAKILPYVERLGTVALGTGSADGTQHVRIVISGS